MSKWQSERSIHEMLKDTPPLRESSDSITSGTEPKFPTSRSMPFPPAYAPPDVSQNGAASSTLLRAGSSKLDAIRNWGVSTYKCTKQILYEKLGKSSRTVDTELEAQIEMLRETQRKYAGVLRLSGALTGQLAAAAATQRALGEAFAELAQKSPELQNQFLYNADTQRTLTRNGDTLLAALHFFNNSLNTLTNKTIEDTLLTIRQYEAARVEYDAYRSELEASGGNPPELLLASIERHRRHYERLRDDSAVKLKLLHENRVKVMNKQLLLFHNAVSAYFSGNNVALEAAVRHFNIHPPPAAPPGPSPLAPPRPLGRAHRGAECGRDVSGARAPRPARAPRAPAPCVGRRAQGLGNDRAPRPSPLAPATRTTRPPRPRAPRPAPLNFSRALLDRSLILKGFRPSLSKLYTKYHIFIIRYCPSLQVPNVVMHNRAMSCVIRLTWTLELSLCKYLKIVKSPKCLNQFSKADDRNRLKR